MHLIYVDESGQTGTNLRDIAQPVFALGALIVPETVWLELEKDLLGAVEKHFPAPRPDYFEIHATEISNPRNGYFRQKAIAQRLAFRDEWFRIACKHGLKLVYRAIVKKRFLEWCLTNFGKGVAINPHVAAFPLVARVVDDYLKSLPESPLGIFIRHCLPGLIPRSSLRSSSNFSCFNAPELAPGIFTEPLIHVGDERFQDVNAWLMAEQKKGRPGK